MRTRTVIPAAAVLSTALLGISACSGGDTPEKQNHANGAPKPAAVSVKIGDSEYGRILVDQSGRTLYAFTKDKAGTSSCDDAGCIAVWPALTSSSEAKAGPGTQESLLAETQPAKGIVQVMYNKWPLYYYVGDGVAGEANGQGVDGEWFVVSADGKLVKKSAS